MIRRILLPLLLLNLLGTAPQSFAAEPDPFDGRLLPLELVMSFRKEIDLTKAQSKSLGKMVVQLQKNVAEKQWQMQSAYFDLMEALEEETIDEERAIALAEVAVNTENQIKLEQVRFLIRTRNMLSKKQIEYLRGKVDDGWTKD